MPAANYLGGGQNIVQAGNSNGRVFGRTALMFGAYNNAKVGHLMALDRISHQGDENRKTISHKTDEGFRADIGKGYINRTNLTGDFDTIYEKNPDGSYKRPEMAENFAKGGFMRNAHGIQPGATAGIDIEKIRSENRDKDLASREAEKAKGNDPTKEDITKAVSANTTKVSAIAVDSKGEASKTSVRKPNEVSDLGSIKNKDTGEWEPIKDEKGNVAQGPLFTSENAKDLYESRGESFNKDRFNQDGK